MDKKASDLVESTVAFRIGVATSILVVIFIIGSIGYHFLEDMSFFEGFYMTFITISTIGFSELRSLSPGGRVFTMVIFVMGSGVILYIASQTTQLLFESELFIKRAMKQQLEQMEDHYIVCGYGRIGHRISEVLRQAGLDVVVVENTDDGIDRIRQDGLAFVQGEAQEESVLEEAGIHKARGLICSLSSDQDNVFVTLVARDMNESIYILVRTNEHKNRKKILRSGADKVISPYEIGADRMANVILRPNVIQFMEKIQKGTSEDHSFDEVIISDGSSLAEKSLAEIGIRVKFNVLIIAIISGETGLVKFNPTGNDVLREGDSLIVLGEMNHINNFRKQECNDYRTLAERAESLFNV